MLTIIIGKSAAGKDSVVKELCEKHGFRRIVTYTTRPKRPKEKDGVDYHFVDDETFLKMIENEEFLEYRTYQASFGDVSYGSAFKDFENAENGVIILTPGGLEEVKKRMEERHLRYTSVYLKAKDSILIDRLKKRGDQTEEIFRRLNCDAQDFKGIEDKVVHIFVNDGTLKIPEIAKYIAAII